MTNKIPKEIEENRKMCSNWYEEGYNDGFKAGQKQKEDAFKEMIDELYNKIDLGSNCKKDDKLFKKYIDELLSQFNSQQKSEMVGVTADNPNLKKVTDTSFLGGYAEFWDNSEDDRWDKEEITGGEE